MRLKAVLVAWVVLTVGCSSTEVVEEPDAGRIEQLARYEVEEEDVQFSAADTQVHGTLTRPAGVDETPGIVLVAGSGPTDRDWNNPLLPGENGTAIELSRRLSEAGIAVLRYDKRGTGHTEMPESISWSEYLAELEGAVETLEQRESVDGERILVAGHSEGGAHALRAAADGRIEVDGLLLLATPGRSMQELVADQVRRQLENAGFNEEAVEGELASLNRAFRAVSRGDQVDAEQVSNIPGLVSLVETLQRENAREFAAEYIDWSPTAAIRRVDEPILLLNGLKDSQIDARADGERLYEAAGGGERVELALVENADHVLKRQTLPADEITPQHSLTYNDPARRLEDTVLEVIVEWVFEQ